ncbi:MAG: cytochrome c [Beijerinckiaceae bacterium]
MKRMQSVRGVLAALAFVVCANAAAMPADAQDPRNLVSVGEGRLAAHRYCAKCHATGRAGASPQSKAPPFRQIARKYQAKPVAGSLFIDGTVVRHPGMPEFEIPIEQADGLIAYIRGLSRNR